LGMRRRLRKEKWVASQLKEKGLLARGEKFLEEPEKLLGPRQVL